MTDKPKTPPRPAKQIDEGKRGGYTGPKSPPPPTNQQIPKVVPDKGKSK